VALIDDRGRLFGKVNLIDAAVAAFLLLLVPLAYGAYLLFRTPNPMISSVKPATIVAGRPSTVVIEGTNFLPFIRARVRGAIGTAEGDGFLLENSTRAEIRLPKLPPGTYELILYDSSRELTSRAGALTVVEPTVPAPPPPPPGAPHTVVAAQVVGVFTNLSKAEAAALRVGVRFSEQGGDTGAEIAALQPPEPGLQRVKMGPETSISSPAPGRFQVPAILSVRCTVEADGCHLGSGVVDRTGVLFLPRDGRTTQFIVQEVRSPTSPVTFPDVVVRVVGTFTGLDDERGRRLRVGTRFPETGTPIAEILTADRLEPAMQAVRVGSGTVMAPVVGSAQLAAVLRLRCMPVTDGCRVADTILARNATLALPGGGALYRFVISDVQPLREQIRARIRVRFITSPEVHALMKVGDIDAGAVIDDKDSAATLASLGTARNVDSGVGISLDPNPDPNRRPFPHQVPQQVVEIDGATLNVVLDQGREGWQYRGELVKIGAGFSFDTAQYTIRGWILDVEPLDKTSQAAIGR
jgi:hypothetical protein